MRPTLIVNPADDSAFSDVASQLAQDGAATTVELERRLRETYPRATVHARELAGELTVIWYVYREGHWVSSRHDPGDRNEGSAAGA
jgi:hypothetical protein